MGRRAHCAVAPTGLSQQEPGLIKKKKKKKNLPIKSIPPLTIFFFPYKTKWLK